MRIFTKSLLALALTIVCVGGAKANRYLVYNNGTAGTNGWDKQAIVKLNSALEDGEQYIVKVKIKVGTATEEQIQLVPDGVAAQYLGLISPTTEFVEYEWWFNSSGAQTELHFFTGKISGLVYFDDISCKKKGSSVELVDNGNFNSTDISNWTNNYQGPSYTIDSDFPDADFVMVYNNGTAGTNGWDKQAIVKLNSALEDGEQYIVKVKIKVGTATEEQIQLVPDGVAAQYLGLISPTTEFVEYEWWFNSSGAQTELHFFTGKISGLVYFDDISCKKKGSSVELVDNGNFNSTDISNWTNNYQGPSYTRWDYEVSATVGADGFATYSAVKAINVDGIVTAYGAKYDGSKIVLTPVTKIPANTGVIIEAAAGTYTIPAINSASALGSSNELQVSNGSVTGNGSTIYALGKKGTKVGFIKVADGVTIPAGKAYLVISASARDFIGFDEDATGIEVVQQEAKADTQYFNLAGQRVAQPTKGLYIVNGKKVIVK